MTKIQHQWQFCNYNYSLRIKLSFEIKTHLLTMSSSLSFLYRGSVMLLCLSQLEFDDGKAGQNGNKDGWSEARRGGTTRHGRTNLLFRGGVWWCEIPVDLRRRGMVVVLCSERYGGGAIYGRRRKRRWW